MSAYALLLPGWDQLSIWGADQDYLYAQVTRNGNSDDDGPDFWITPPRYPVCRHPRELGHAISQVTGTDLPAVLNAMATGAGMNAHAFALASEARPAAEQRE